MWNRQSVEQSEHPHHFSIKLTALWGLGSWHPETITVVTWIPMTNTRIMKKLKIVQELPKYETETQSEQMLLDKWH